MIETKNFLPFDDTKSFKSNHSGYKYVRFCVPARSEEEKNLLKRMPFPDDYSHKNFIIKDIDLETGETFITRHFIGYFRHGNKIEIRDKSQVSESDIKDLRKVNEEFRLRGSYYKIAYMPTNYREFTETRLVITVLNDMIILRFFCFLCGSWFNQNKPPYWIEKFRIVIGRNFANIENKKDCIPFDYSHVGGLVRSLDCDFDVCLNDDEINAFFSILSDYSGLGKTEEIIETFKLHNDCSDKQILASYIFFVLVSTKRRTRIFKNVPDDILSDLKKPSENLIVKDLLDTQLSKEENFDNDEMPFHTDSNRDDTFFDLCSSTYLVYEETDKYLIARIYRLGLETERAYFSKNGTYFFQRNHLDNVWFSKVGRYSGYLSIHEDKCHQYEYENLLKPTDRYVSVYFKNINGEITEILKDDNIPKFFTESTERIFGSRIIIPKDISVRSVTKYIYLQANYKWAEQAVKMGFLNFINSITFYPVHDKHHYKNANGISANILLERMASLSDIFGVSPTCVKYIDKSIYFFDRYRYHENDYALIKYNQTLSFLRSVSTDNVFIAKSISVFRKFNLSSLRDLLKTIKDNGRSPERFLKTLIKIYGNNAEEGFRYYIDYLRMREDAEKLGSFKYPPVVKIKDIKFYHDRAMRDYKVYNQLSRAKSNNKFFSEVVTGNDYKMLCYKNNDFMIVSPTKAEDLVEEGHALSHCVGSYIGSVAKKHTKIYFLRRVSAPDIPYYTVEVQEDGGQNIMKQCYGSHDHIGSNPNRKAFIEEWTNVKKIRIGCRYYNERNTNNRYELPADEPVVVIHEQEELPFF